MFSGRVQYTSHLPIILDRFLDPGHDEGRPRHNERKHFTHVWHLLIPRLVHLHVTGALLLTLKALERHGSNYIASAPNIEQQQFVTTQPLEVAGRWEQLR
jgi:hypothetical protein